MTDSSQLQIQQVQSQLEMQTTILHFEEKMLQFLNFCGLPTESILVDVNERKKVFQNIQSTIEILDFEKRLTANYISKFLAAVSSGLFDAALSYLWDETIKQLRVRVAQYDIQYFYDIAVKSEKRNRLSDVSDLNKLDDNELITGAKEIGLISELGFRHLDYIRYMRNWASAAHPNQVEITGLQLISWLETCIKEVISLPLSNVTIEIGKLLKNIKNHTLNRQEAEAIGGFFCELTQDRVNSLASGFFGIYTRVNTEQQTRQNIHLLLPLLWDRVDEDVRNEFGVKYARYIAVNDQEEARLARDFLQVVSGEQYLPEPIRASEIKVAIENLHSAHHSYMDNYYKEPPFAKQLERLVGTHNIPKQLDNSYVFTVIDAYLTNGNGVCWDADVVYQRLIKKFTTRQTIIAILSFTNDTISSKLQFNLCSNNYRTLLDMLRPMTTSPAVIELLDKIQKYSGALYQMKNDASMQRQVEILKVLIK